MTKTLLEKEMKNSYFLLWYPKNNPSAFRTIHNFRKNILFLTVFLIYTLVNRDNFITSLLIEEIKLICKVTKQFDK